MFHYLTLYNNSFQCIYMFLKSVLQVTASDSPTTIMSSLNAFFTAHTHHLRYFHIADDYHTWLRGHQRSFHRSHITYLICDHQQTAALKPTATEYRGTSTGIFRTTDLYRQNLESPVPIFWRESAVPDPMHA